MGFDTIEINLVWLKLDWYPLIYSIEFKLGKMLHGQRLHAHMLTRQMFPRQLTTHTDGLREACKKKYESLDICPNWVYPTYLVA